MKSYIVYTENGQIVRCGDCQDETLELQAQDGELVMEGEYTGNQYVSDGVLVDMTPQPSSNHIFDYALKTWVFDNSVAAAQAYAKRNQLLRDGPDRISPLWWSTMTAEQQQAWTDYRQSLLDITDQPGFPADIEWPTKP